MLHSLLQVCLRGARRSAAASLVALSLPIAAAPTLDTSFGVNGLVERSLAGSFGQADSIIALADSTLLTSGFFWHYYRGSGGIRVYDAFVSAHYSANGKQVLAPPPFFPYLVQRDGKMITVNSTGLTRVNQDGSPDPGYITDGAAGIPWYAGLSQGGLAGMALQADGKVVVAGNSSYTVVLLRFNTNGSLDPTFNYIGALIVPHGDSDIDAATIGPVIQPDGKIAVAANSYLGLAQRLTLLRFNADGSADAAFGNNGRSTIPNGTNSYVLAGQLALQPNGRLIVLGADAVAVMKMAGFRPQDGASDPIFGNSGVVNTPIGDATSSAQVDQAVVTPDGRLLVAFSSSDQTSYKLMRFTVDGAPDSTFGDAGSFTSAPLQSVTAIALLPNGDLALGGGTAGGNLAVGLFTSGPSPAIEYYNPSLNHYFMTVNPQEVAELDLGVFAGWQRTGLSFLTYGSAPAAAGTSAGPVCRFYIPPQHGNSHFFSADPVECAIARDKITTDPNFSGYVEETPSAFFITLPDKVTGACPANTTPVYRLWNQGSASNHRYTTSVVVKNQMIASGWLAEGYGPDAVDMCAP